MDYISDYRINATRPKRRRLESLLRERFHALRDTCLYGEISVDHCLHKPDFLKAFLDPRIKWEVSISREMLAGCHLRLQPCPGGPFRADTFQDSPWLSHLRSKFEHALDLISLGKGSPVDQDEPVRMFSQKVFRRLQHHVHAEVILLGRILKVFRSKQGGPDLIFADYRSTGSRGQSASQCALARARQARHHNDHVKRITRREPKLFAGSLDALGFSRLRNREGALRLAPVGIAFRDHDVEDPLP